MEIGGYLELEQFSGNEYYPDLIALNSGRNALAYLISTKKINKVYIPRFLCDSIYKVCERENCEYEYYDVDGDFQPIFEKTIGTGERIYIVNYYSQVSNIKMLCEKYKNVIIDNAHAFFEKPIKGVETIYSCRKFFGVPDGAYLASDIYMELENDVSIDRMSHILGRYEAEASHYYQSYCNNESIFYNLRPANMSALTHNILRATDYEKIQRKRNENFKYLHEELAEKNKLSICIPNAPYMYPFYTENGYEIRKRLIGKKIYIPTLWPNAMKYGGVAEEYSKNILPLPIDQRYSLEDMRIIINELFKLI